MAEFERERLMTAPAELVFTVATDVDRLDHWLPGVVTVHAGEPEGLNIDVSDPDGGHEAPGVLGASRDRLRLEWGRDGGPDYSGWLQVSAAGHGTSQATLHLSSPGDEAPGEVRQRLDDALERLANLVAERR